MATHQFRVSESREVFCGTDAECDDLRSQNRDVLAYLVQACRGGQGNPFFTASLPSLTELDLPAAPSERIPDWSGFFAAQNLPKGGKDEGVELMWGGYDDAENKETI